MSYSGDAAEQVVRMSLNGVEIAAKISGKAAERLATLIYAVLKDQKRTKGKIRLTGLLKSGKELKVFSVKDGDLARFSKAAKEYGVLYCVLKDRNAGDGLTDVMVRAEDASKINRIYERFNLATIDMASIKTEIERNKERAGRDGDEMVEPLRDSGLDATEKDPVNNKIDEFMKSVVPDKKKSMEKGQAENPSEARTTKSHPSESLSRNSGTETDKASADPGRPENRPSVRAQLNEIKREKQEAINNKQKNRGKAFDNTHQVPKKKKKRNKGDRS